MIDTRGKNTMSGVRFGARRRLMTLGAGALLMVGTMGVLFALPASAAPGPATHLVVSAPGSATAGTSISVTVTAEDASNATDTSDSRPFTLTSSDAKAVLPNNLSLTNGVATFNVTLKTAGSQTIVAADLLNSLTGSTSVTVNPAAAVSLAVNLPAFTFDGLPLNFSVSAFDAYGNAATGYTGTLHFTSSDARATLPADTALVAGTGNFQATLITTGRETITATDTTTSSINGTSSIEVYTVRVTGYDLAGADGGAFAIGGEPFEGSLGGQHLNAPVVGIATTPDAKGYWMAAKDGGVFSFGDAKFYGSMGGKKLNAPIVGIASTPDGHGYWLVAADGGVFSFGDAPFLGSHGAIPISLNKPVVGMAVTPDGLGYWLAAADGGVFAFGDAPYRGSMGDQVINQPVVGIARTFDGQGYWLVSNDGGVFTFGDAQYASSLPALKDNVTNVVGIAGTSDAKGYWVVQSNGTVTALGDAAPEFGSVSGPTDIVGISAGPSTTEQFI